MPDQPELALEMKVPGADVLKRLRASVFKAHAGSEELDHEIAKAFGLPVARFTRSLTDGLALMKAAIPDWSAYTLEAYAASSDRADDFLLPESWRDDTFYPEGYGFKLSGGTAWHQTERDERAEFTAPSAELAVVREVLNYLIRIPKMDAAAEQGKAKHLREAAERAAQREVDDKEPEAAPEPEKPAKQYPATYEGHVEWCIDWLEGMRETVRRFPDGNDEVETTVGIIHNYDVCIRALSGQLRAIQIVQEMMEAEVAKSPSPRMKALKAAIEAIYTA